MQLVVRYAKSGKDDKESTREVVLPAKRMTPGDFNWHEAVAMAIYHKQAGERIIALIEAGYH